METLLLCFFSLALGLAEDQSPLSGASEASKAMLIARKAKKHEPPIEIVAQVPGQPQESPVVKTAPSGAQGRISNPGRIVLPEPESTPAGAAGPPTAPLGGMAGPKTGIAPAATKESGASTGSTGGGSATGESTPVSPLEQKGPVENIDNISPSAPSEEQQVVSGTIRYEEKLPPDALKVTLTIFDALDEALVKSPRGAAVRALLPISKSAYARATEQTPAAFNYDNGVWSEQTRRMGIATVFEPPWKVFMRLVVAKYTVQQQKVDCLMQLWQLRSDVRSAYTEVVVAQESLETLNSLWDLAHRLRVVSEKRFQAGDVPELDVLKSRLAESQADVDRRVGFRRVVRAKQQLNIILGRAPYHALIVPRLPSFLTQKSLTNSLQVKDPLMPEFNKPVPPLQHFTDIAMENRYEIKSLEKQIAVAKSQLRYTVANAMPNIPFWYGASRTGNPAAGPKLGAFYVGFNIQSNATNFNQGDLSMFKATVRQLKYQLSAQRNQVASDVSSAYNNLLAARHKMRTYEEHVLADSTEVARLARRSYEVGQSDITSTIQAMQNNVQIRMGYLDAITNYQGAFTDLERSCGTPLLSADDW